MIQLHAQPYNIDATGFYFETLEAYDAKVAACKDAFGCPVEEFEIQFIDGDDLEGELATAISLSQANMTRYLELIEDSDEDELTRLIIGLSEGYDLGTFDTDSIEIYEVEYLADQFIDEGMYGEVPENLRNYLDTEMMGRDLGYDGYVETKVGGRRLIYRMQ
jgi:hypothetical protein